MGTEGTNAIASVRDEGGGGGGISQSSDRTW